MKHPLVNSDSTHYDTQKDSAIAQLEQRLSVAAMMGFCEGSIFKYEYRKHHKGQLSSDDKKIATYKAYGEVIKMLLHKGYKSQTVSHALESEGIHYEY